MGIDEDCEDIKQWPSLYCGCRFERLYPEVFDMYVGEKSLNARLLRSSSCTSDSDSSCHSKHCNKLEMVRERMCSQGGYLAEDPGGGTCLERDASKEVAKKYCSESNNIRTKPVCNEYNLANYYHEIAEKYCKSEMGRADDWCSCYNVLNEVCEIYENAAGCADKEMHYDSLVNATPREFRSAWAGREGCFGGVCVGDKYIVPNSNLGCDAPIQICKQDIQAANISQSTIEASCKIEGDKKINDGSGGSGGSGGNDKTEPTSVNTINLDDSKLKLAGVGSSMCLFIILILILR